MFESSQTAPGAEGATQSQRNSAVAVAVALAIAVTIAVSVAVTVAMGISSFVLSRGTAVRMILMLRRHGGAGSKSVAVTESRRAGGRLGGVATQTGEEQHTNTVNMCECVPR